MGHDPKPEARCRCVHRPVDVREPARTALGLPANPSDDYYDRCPARARSDGLCEQCARPMHEQPCNIRCCRCPDQPPRRVLTDPCTPCLDHTKAPF